MPTYDDLNVLTFIASIVQSLAWPMAVVVSLFLFRSPISKKLEEVLSIEALGSRVSFERELEEAEGDDC